MSKTMEWGIFRKGDPTATPAENLRYATREAADRTRKRSYLHPEHYEVRGREIGPWGRQSERGGQVIPAEAVEAAARGMFAEEQCDRRQKLDVESSWRGRLDDRDRAEYRRLSRAALEAAAPHMLAEAWDACANLPSRPHPEDNPYRSQA